MSDVEKKITEEELKKIKDHQLTMNNLLRDIGHVENQKHLLLHDYAGLIKDNEDHKKELEEKYGFAAVDDDRRANEDYFYAAMGGEAIKEMLSMSNRMELMKEL